MCVCVCVIIIIKGITIVPIYHTGLECRALYTHTCMHACTCACAHIHTHTRMHARTHTCTHTQKNGHVCEKVSLEIIIEQVCLEGGLDCKGRIRLAECLRQTVSNSWASARNDGEGRSMYWGIASTDCFQTESVHSLCL